MKDMHIWISNWLPYLSYTVKISNMNFHVLLRQSFTSQLIRRINKGIDTYRILNKTSVSRGTHSIRMFGCV